MPGDFGFDPLGLGEDADSLRWYVQAELLHARFAMAGVAGILFTDVGTEMIDRLMLIFCSVIRYFISIAVSSSNWIKKHTSLV